ncbi:MAG: hypothetical protein AAGC73_02820 [Verrucomicrobiota bacterium]
MQKKRITNWLKLIATYFFGQGATQVIQLTTGFIIINFLTKEEYATFTLVLALQSMANVLVELGITRTLVPLIGKRYNDQDVVGRYFAACRFFRNATLSLGSVGLLIAFYFSAQKYDWSVGYWVVLWLTVIVALQGFTVGSIYTSVFLLRQDLKTLYKIGLISGTSRLLAICLAQLMVGLSAQLALIFGSIQALIGGYTKKLLAKGAYSHPAKGTSLAKEKKEVLSQALPRAPSVAFFAFEGQFTIFLMGIIGTTAGLGELGALGRLGMLFLIVNKTGTMLFSPHFSKREVHQVLPHALVSIGGASLFGSLVVGFIYLFPETLLILLGEGYQHLRFEIVLVVMGSALRFVDIVSFSICLSRKYIFPWFSVVDILPLIIAMVVGFSFFDLSTVRNMLYFSLVMSVIKLLTKFFILTVGIGRELRAANTV